MKSRPNLFILLLFVLPALSSCAGDHRVELVLDDVAGL